MPSTVEVRTNRAGGTNCLGEVDIHQVTFEICLACHPYSSEAETILELPSLNATKSLANEFWFLHAGIR